MYRAWAEGAECSSSMAWDYWVKVSMLAPGEGEEVIRQQLISSCIPLKPHVRTQREVPRSITVCLGNDKSEI